jgi:hypothetical protein
MFEGVWKGVEILITDGPQAVYKVKGLFDKILAGQENAMQQRFAAIDTWRSVLRAVLIDADQESFERQAVNFGGLDKILEQATLRLSGDSQIPAVLLGGPRNAGLNASDATELRSFYDRTAASQESILGPRIKELVRVKLNMMGRADLLDKVTIKFEPLFTPSALEDAQARASQATCDNTYITAGVFTPEEIALSRVLDKGQWSTDWSAVDRPVREKLLKTALAQLEASTEVPTVGEGELGAAVGSRTIPSASSGASPGSTRKTQAGDVLLGKDVTSSGPDVRPAKKTKDLKE